MTGIFGGTTTGSSLDAMGDLLEHREWYGREQFEDGDFGLGVVHHGEQAGYETVAGAGYRGVVYGAVGNRETFGDAATIVERALADPAGTFAMVDGPCAVAAYDVTDGRFVAATDRIGSRPLYYTAGDLPFAVGSQVKTVLERVDDVALDERAVADLLTKGSVWGEKTLAEGVKRLPPATVLEYRDGEVTTTRYWRPEFDPAPPSQTYLTELASRYQGAVNAMADTMTGDAGVWLSGGLDSRALVASLARSRRPASYSLSAYTYDANPPSGGNPELARRIADAKGLPIEEVELTAEDLLAGLDEILTVTDGMLRWPSTWGVAAIYGLEGAAPDVMLEACGQGELLGELVWRPYVTEASSPVEALYGAEGSLGLDRVRSLLAADVDPLGTFKREVERSDESGLMGTVLDVHFRNHYSAGHFVSNQVTRVETDTRTPFADGSFLSHIARLPPEFRRGVVPFTDWSVPAGTTRPKLELMRLLDDELASIPYERTRRPPTEPLAVHTAAYLANKGLESLRDRLGFGPDRTLAAWYRSYAPLREFVDDLLDGAAGRSCFDADAVAELRRAHVAGETNNICAIGAVTTVEHWLRRHVDGRRRRPTPAPRVTR